MTQLLRHRADRRSIAITVLTLCVIVVPFCWDMPTAVLFFWPLLVYVLSFSCCTINHNHQHSRVFRKRPLNVAFQVLLTLAKGHSSSTVVVPHNYNHHKSNCREGDWIRPALAGSGPGWRRLLRYVVRASVSMRRERRGADAPALPRRRRLELWIERGALVLFILLLAAISAVQCVLLVLVPWALSMLTLVAINLPQHDGCDPSSGMNHSRNFVSPLGNWLLFNNGFHTIHHLRPGLHWSLLPAAHARLVAPYIHRRLIQGSILHFVLRQYTFWPSNLHAVDDGGLASALGREPI